MELLETVVRPSHLYIIVFLSFHSQGFPLALSQLFDSVKYDIKAPPVPCVCCPPIFLNSSFLPLPLPLVLVVFSHC